MTMIPQAEYVKLYEQGLTIPEIGKRLRRPDETVKRALRRAGAIPQGVRREIPDHDAKVARAQHLREVEGMPINWIAEDLGVSRQFIVDHTVTNHEANREWKKLWAFLMHNPELMELHKSIAPKQRLT